MPAIRGPKSKSKTRRRRRDLDQIHADLHDAKHLSHHRDAHAPEDLPAMGDFYCVECAKWFEAEHNLVAHRKGKPHKRRVRQLREEPYTQKEAEAAAGLTTDNGRSDRMEVDSSDEPKSHERDGQKGDDNDDEEYDAFFSIQ